MSKQNKTDELVQISVPTKKISLEVTEDENIEIVLRPFRQRDFATAIDVINKYFDRFNAVRTDYLNSIRDIIARTDTDEAKKKAIDEFDATFNEGMKIAKAILSGGGESIGEDIKSIVSMSIYRTTRLVKSDGATERSQVDLEIDDLTWGECLVLLGSTVGLNMDFFNQNSKAMNLIAVLNDEEPSPSPRPKAGAKSSPDSSKLTTAEAK